MWEKGVGTNNGTLTTLLWLDTPLAWDESWILEFGFRSVFLVDFFHVNLRKNLRIAHQNLHKNFAQTCVHESSHQNQHKFRTKNRCDDSVFLEDESLTKRKKKSAPNLCKTPGPSPKKRGAAGCATLRNPMEPYLVYSGGRSGSLNRDRRYYSCDSTRYPPQDSVSCDAPHVIPVVLVASA